MADKSPEEFLRLLAPLRDALWRYARRSLGSDDRAGDAVQEAALVAWSDFGRFEPGTNFRAWMYRILTNAIFRTRRRDGRQRSLEALESEPVQTADAVDLTSVDGASLREHLDDDVAAAMDELSAAERQCLLLRVLDGLTYREISGALDMPAGTVMSLVHRARLKLKAALNDAGVGSTARAGEHR
ncbi:MAG: RNA polymerase sigma factor [Planctomycetia bacterium]|nr:MAG: RNA polymerase sigma factor [Planctomycetia bacterium]